MKLKHEFAVREIADEFVLVPMGEGALEFSAMAFCNEVGKFLIKLLESEQTVQSMVDAVIENYEVDEATARTDVEGFVEKLISMGIVA